MSGRRLLLGSGGLSTDERRERWRAAFCRFIGDATRVLFVPHAMRDHDAIFERMKTFGLGCGHEIESLHQVSDPQAAIEAAEVVFVGGGNSFRLLAEMQRLSLMPLIQARVAGGMPYIGISAGSNLACPTIMTTNDMPITLPDGFDGLDLVPFQINPHYFEGLAWLRKGDESFVSYGGETRDSRISEFHELHDRPVLGIWEGGWVEVDGTKMNLDGADARLFRKGQEAEDLVAGASLDALLTT